MTVEIVTVNDNLVARDTERTWRWFDAWGPNVTKWEVNPANSQIVSTTTAAGHDVDVYTGGTLVAADSIDGGAITLVPAATEDQGLQMVAGEAFYFGNKWPCYFGCKFSNVDVSEADQILGLVINDEELIGGMTDGMYFRTVDASAALSFVLEKDSAETATAVATMADATAITAEFYYDGTNVSAYINGTLVATVAATNANFPNDEHLAAALALATGANAANTMTVYWARCIQIRQT
jgi:hypothetical protein